MGRAGALVGIGLIAACGESPAPAPAKVQPVVESPAPVAPAPAATEAPPVEAAPAAPAEVPEDIVANVEAIRLAESAHAMVLGKYLAAPAWPRAADAVNTEALAWAEQGDWKKLGWTPAGPVRGSYEVKLVRGGFVVTATIDADGDGVPARATATHKEHGKLSTPEGVR